MGSVAQFAHEESCDDEENISKKIQTQVYIKHFDRPIFFGFAVAFQDMHHKLPEVKVVVMRMSKVPYIDQSGIYVIEDAVLSLKEKGVVVMMIDIQEQPKDMLKNIGLIPCLIPEINLFSNFRDCVEALETGDTIKMD
ncbi:MAG: sodium-independent anion transporter [Methylococcales bacterium]|nr:sodium-independent anion transporter [Methylococcales bacterium]